MNEDDDQNDGTYQFKSLFYKADIDFIKILIITHNVCIKF